MRYDRLQNVVTTTANIDVDLNNYTYIADGSINSVNLQLPDIEGVESLVVNFVAKDITNDITITGYVGQTITILGQTFTTFTFSTQGDSVSLQIKDDNRFMI